MGIITYKNIFPSDFEKLQIGKRYVSKLFSCYESYRNERINAKRKEIEILNEKREKLELESIRTKNELMALYLPNNYIKETPEGRKITDSLELIKYMNENKRDSLDYIDYNGSYYGSRERTKPVSDVYIEIESKSGYNTRKKDLETSIYMQIKK